MSSKKLTTQTVSCTRALAMSRDVEQAVFQASEREEPLPAYHHATQLDLRFVLLIYSLLLIIAKTQLPSPHSSCGTAYNPLECRTTFFTLLDHPIIHSGPTSPRRSRTPTPHDGWFCYRTISPLSKGADPGFFRNGTGLPSRTGKD